VKVDDRFSYATGYTFGSRIRERLMEDERTADTATIIKGVTDGLEGHDPAYPREEVEAAFAKVREVIEQRRAEKLYQHDPAFRKLADDNAAHSAKLLEHNGELAGVETMPNGVQVQIIEPGDGRVIGNATFVTGNFTVSLADGALVRASEPGKPSRVATANVLPALLEATRGMHVGAKWRVVLPPEQAYGLAGKPPVIGPNQAIQYELELVGAE
jgi:FKBP-type peptidyl-prolyl cis-trans isomerase